MKEIKLKVVLPSLMEGTITIEANEPLSTDEIATIVDNLVKKAAGRAFYPPIDSVDVYFDPTEFEEGFATVSAHGFEQVKIIPQESLTADERGQVGCTVHLGTFPLKERVPRPLVPPPLNYADTHNFQTLLRAAANGDLILASAIRKSDGASVALVMAMSADKDNPEQLLGVPLAVMVEGNPYELYDDPLIE